MPEVVRGSRPSHSLPSSPIGHAPISSPFDDTRQPRPADTALHRPHELTAVVSRESARTLKSTRGDEVNHTTTTADTTTAAAAKATRRSIHLPRASVDQRPRLSEAKSRKSMSWRRERRDSMRAVEADVYYDSRAATKREFRRRATTLQEYYTENPKLLPQLPFTLHHGWRRYRLGMLILLMFIDACVVPIVLYYGMDAGHVQGWIIFAIVTTVWGGPTYLEMMVRTWRLIKKERFYRPLGTNSRWCFDLTTWTSVIAITAVTSLFIVGSAPHIVWLRVLSMPGPALLYSIGGVLFVVTLYHLCGWKAPCRISSTAKGDPVRPGIYYFVEDIIAVNAGAGRPYREALAARYESSPRFRRMMSVQSIFWSVPALVLAVPLTVIAVIHPVPAKIAYGVCWGVPFVWVTLWAVISAYWIRHDLRREREEWEADDGEVVSDQKQEDLEAGVSPELTPEPEPEPELADQKRETGP